MENNINELDKFYGLSPTKWIKYMFDKSSENGVMLIPDFPYDSILAVEEERGLRCKMEWNLYDRDNLIINFRTLSDSLRQIGMVYEEIGGKEEKAKEILKDKLYSIWQIYIRDFDTSKFNTEDIFEIQDRLEIKQEIKRIAKSILDNDDINECDREFLSEYLNISVSDSEKLLYENYRNTIYNECENRLGRKMYAYQVIIRAKRLCKLYSLEAPKTVTDNEGRLLATALTLHYFCLSAERTDDTSFFYQPIIDDEIDEEFDDMFRPKKENSRKSLAPLFIYLILKEHSTFKKPMRQKEILEFLEKYPYEIRLERKALSRIIHGLADSQISIRSDQRKGTWIEHN